MSNNITSDTQDCTPAKDCTPVGDYTPVKDRTSAKGSTPFKDHTPLKDPYLHTANSNQIRVSPYQALKLDGPIVEICVGKDLPQKIFSVHQALIAPRSEFFERAFNGNWKESESRLVNLPDDDATIFSLYVQLLYTGQIPAKNDDWEFVKLCKLYVLCEKLQDIYGKNAILQAMCAEIEGTSTKRLSVLAVNTIYDGTPENSPARRLVLETFAKQGSHECFYGEILDDCYSTEFVRHLAVQLLKQRSLTISDILENHQKQVKEKEVAWGGRIIIPLRRSKQNV